MRHWRSGNDFPQCNTIGVIKKTSSFLSITFSCDRLESFEIKRPRGALNFIFFGEKKLDFFLKVNKIIQLVYFFSDRNSIFLFEKKGQKLSRRGITGEQEYSSVAPSVYKRKRALESRLIMAVSFYHMVCLSFMPFVQSLMIKREE